MVMSGAFGSGPSAPDPEKTAAAQYRWGKRAREDSLTDAYGPSGRSRYISGPGGRFTLQTELSPELQGRFSGLAQGLGGFDRARMEQSLYDRSMGLIQPDMDESRERLMTRLTTQGIPTGSEAHGKEVDRFARQEDQLRRNLALDAIAGAGAESRAERGMDISELGSILGMAPRAEGNIAMQAPDIASMIYDNYAQRTANHNAQKQGISDMASTAAMAAAMGSDSRLKTNIKKIGEKFGFNWYRWTWNDRAEAIGYYGEAEGVIAQEVERSRPDLVVMKDGYKAVIYGGLA